MVEAIRSRMTPRASIAIAFAAVYLIWGSTYLAIRWAIDDVPPFLMAAARFLAAGGAMFLWARARGAAAPQPRHWGSATLVGGLMLLGGNGGVVWSEQHIPSGVTALIVAAVPLWMALLQGVTGNGRPGLWTWAGIALGIVGIAVLVGPDAFRGGSRMSLVATAVLVFASLSWSVGSLLAHRVSLPASPVMATGMEMIGGGALLALLGFATGEGARLDLAAVSARSALSLAYLVVFGSIVGFTAYIWLLKMCAPSRVATYAFVNPVVAVLLGWAFAGEPFGARTALATTVIVAAVAIITLVPQRGERGAEAKASDAPQEPLRTSAHGRAVVPSVPLEEPSSGA
jgi:drug/metabolite transporter (DMT)-like permease